MTGLARSDTGVDWGGASVTDLAFDEGRIMVHVDDEIGEYHITMAPSHSPSQWEQALRWMSEEYGLEVIEDDPQCVEWLQGGELRQWLSPRWIW